MDELTAQEHYDTFVAETGITPLKLSLKEEGTPGLEAVMQALRDELKPQAKGQSVVSDKPRQPVDHTEVSAERFRMATFLKP
jgi:hypothetical protein